MENNVEFGLTDEAKLVDSKISTELQINILLAISHYTDAGHTFAEATSIVACRGVLFLYHYAAMGAEVEERDPDPERFMEITRRAIAARTKMKDVGDE